VRWGFLSTAAINDSVLAGARLSDRVDVVAVGSRSLERARTWADERGIARAHGSYEDLLADDEVEAVYISLPNGLHAEWALKALEAGKHVLVEKPFSRHAHEVERCFDAAEERGLVLSEGFMWRHHPQTRVLTELVDRGAIGELRLVRATFSFPLDRPDDVRWSAALDGGALMDVGCYCISGVRLLAGEPETVLAVATGDAVDARLAGLLRFAGGELAHFDCGFDLPARDELEVVGADGTLFLDDPWHCREPVIELRRSDGTEQRFDVEHADPYQLELEDISDAARDGRPPLLGRDDALGQARVLEAILS
jgi:xylose dehydrogenase (NAD/NADP)